MPAPAFPDLQSQTAEGDLINHGKHPAFSLRHRIREDILLRHDKTGDGVDGFGIGPVQILILIYRRKPARTALQKGAGCRMQVGRRREKSCHSHMVRIPVRTEQMRHIRKRTKPEVCKRSTPVRIIHSVPAVNKNLPRRSFKQMNTAAGRGLKNPERDIRRERNFLIIQIEVLSRIPVKIPPDA